MISRRSIRIKALQALYSQLILDEDNAIEAKESFDLSIQEVIEVNLIYLSYIYEVIGYIEEYSKQQSQKHLISDEEKNVSTSLLSLELFQNLKANTVFHKSVKKYKLKQYIQSEYVKKMFLDLIGLNEYKEYIQTKGPQTEYNLCNAFLKRILFRNEDMVDYLESNYANISEDSDLVHFTLRRNLKAILEDKPIVLSFGINDSMELREFADNLIDTTINHHKEYMEYIEPKLKGWDAERIPMLDMIIIKMCISEMLYFPTIPLKVSVNEYIDLTKLFCSAKSKDFINGIIDRIMRDFQHQGKINKTGRGLN